VLASVAGTALLKQAVKHGSAGLATYLGVAKDKISILREKGGAAACFADCSVGHGCRENIVASKSSVAEKGTGSMAGCTRLIRCLRSQPKQGTAVLLEIHEL